ncbi:MAG: hypothetical protein O2973_04710 [Gemmatimonadetes bacterium]|nr:hypothetical protein [Gemmatimonadota bacterium]
MTTHDPANPPSGDNADVGAPRVSDKRPEAGARAADAVKDYRGAWNAAAGGRRRVPRLPARRKTLPWIGALALVAAGAWALDVAYVPSAAPLPASVLGVWSTDAREYSDRRFELRPDSVFFQVGPVESMLLGHKIIAVSQLDSPDGSSFLINYLEDDDGGEPLTFTFLFRSADPQQIVIAGQRDVVWTRRVVPAQRAP